MIYFTSDLHFGHDREFIYGPRGFNSIYKHDIEIIERWNSIVGHGDEIYVLGDLMLGADHEYGLNCLQELNGQIYVIEGNHDTATRLKEYASLSHIKLIGLAYILKTEGWKFYLCHYKTETSCLENMARIKNHLINLHGHTHSCYKFENGNPYQYNVALDAHDCFPVNIFKIQHDIEQEVQKCLSFL